MECQLCSRVSLMCDGGYYRVLVLLGLVFRGGVLLRLGLCLVDDVIKLALYSCGPLACICKQKI